MNLFATGADLEPGIRRVESERRLQYVLCGLFDTAALTTYGSLLDIEGLGVNTTGDHITGPRYLVASAFRKIEVRPVSQRRGGMKYAVDQLENPGSITVLPGGMCQSCLLAGQIGTVATDREAISLFQDFSRTVTKGFKRVRGYAIGPEALRLSTQGIRLTTSVRSPVEYDIRV